MTRIAYLTNQYPSVSHTFIRREIRALEDLGWDVARISVRRGTAAADPADVEEAARTGYLLGRGPAALLAEALPALLRPRALAGLRTALGMHRRSERGLVRHLAYWVEAAALLRRLRATGAVHVHVHFGTNAAAVARIARRMGGPAYSMTVHGPDEFDAPIGLSLGGKMADAAFTLAVSRYGAAQLRRWAPPEHWDRIHVVRCTVDPSWFGAAGPVAEDSDTLVCVGRLSAQKGHLLLIDAFAETVSACPEARLVLVGDGELRGAVEARIAAHGLREQVTITGWQTEAEVRRHLAEARAFVLPSFAEGLPVGIMEALAMERPVVSTYVAGIPELVRQGENGWLVPAGDVPALTDALVEVFDAPVERLRAMGAAGRERVAAQHSAATEAARIDALLRGCVGDR